MKFIHWIQKALSSLFFIGYFPLAPGTVGSALVVAGLWYLQTRMHIVFSPQQWWIAIIVLTALSIVIASRPQEVFGKDDPSEVIIDECVGQLVTFSLFPLPLITCSLGFSFSVFLIS
jgi:phosphatidylglycerophosphatase A